MEPGAPASTATRNRFGACSLLRDRMRCRSGGSGGGGRVSTCSTGRARAGGRRSTHLRAGLGHDQVRKHRARRPAQSEVDRVRARRHAKHCPRARRCATTPCLPSHSLAELSLEQFLGEARLRRFSSYMRPSRARGNESECAVRRPVVVSASRGAERAPATPGEDGEKSEWCASRRLRAVDIPSDVRVPRSGCGSDKLEASAVSEDVTVRSTAVESPASTRTDDSDATLRGPSARFDSWRATVHHGHRQAGRARGAAQPERARARAADASARS